MGQKEKRRPIQTESYASHCSSDQSEQTSMFGHGMRREEDSTLRVVMQLNINGKRPRGIPRLRWLDNIDSHLKGKNT